MPDLHPGRAVNLTVLADGAGAACTGGPQSIFKNERLLAQIAGAEVLSAETSRKLSGETLYFVLAGEGVIKDDDGAGTIVTAGDCLGTG